MAEYMSAFLLSPAKSTILRAIHRNHLQLVPGSNLSLIPKHLIKNIATSKGYLDQEFKNIRLTKYDSDQPSSPSDIDTTTECTESV